MDDTTFRRLARIGAEHRLRQLQEEEAQLRAFLEPLATASDSPVRRRMTAEQRKAHGDRMRAFWAARRATQAPRK
jgi:hypothetical protein